MQNNFLLCANDCMKYQHILQKINNNAKNTYNALHDFKYQILKQDFHLI